MQRTMWLVSALAFSVSIFHRTSPSVLSPYLMEELGMTAAGFGLWSSIYFYVYTLTQVPTGLVVDRFGPKRIIVAGTLLGALGTLVVARGGSVAAAFAGRALTSAGVSTLYVSHLKLTADWFPGDEFAILSGLTATIGNLGSLLGTIPMAHLLKRAGFSNALTWVGLVTLAWSGVCCLALKDAPRGEGSRSSWSFSAVSNLKLALANHANRLLAVAYFFIYGAYGAFLGMWSVPLMRNVYGLQLSQAAAYNAALVLGFMLGGPCIGYAADRLFSRRSAYKAASFVFMGLWAMLLVLYCSRGFFKVLSPWFFAFGFFGSCFLLTFPATREVNPANLMGVATGLNNMAGFLGVALIQSLVGVLLDLGWTGAVSEGIRVYPASAFRWPILVSTISVAIGSAIVSRLPLAVSGTRFARPKPKGPEGYEEAEGAGPSPG